MNTFREARARLLQALKQGDIRYEARDVQAEKNLLSIQAITEEKAVEVVLSTKGNQAKKSLHHQSADIWVWVFQPTGWYIKFYEVDQVVVISFHRSEPG